MNRPSTIVVAHQSLSSLWLAVQARKRRRERVCAFLVVVGLPAVLGAVLHWNW